MTPLRRLADVLLEVAGAGAVAGIGVLVATGAAVAAGTLALPVAGAAAVGLSVGASVALL